MSHNTHSQIWEEALASAKSDGGRLDSSKKHHPANPTEEQPQTNRVQVILQSKVLVAGIVTVLVALLLLVVNPPLAQQKDSNKRSLLKITAWSLVVGLLAFVLPTGASLFCGTGSP